MMDRRQFLHGAGGFGIAGFGAAAGCSGAGAESAVIPRILPAALKRGMRIGLLAPASPLHGDGGYERALDRVRALGFDPVLAPSCRKVHGYLAGRDDERLADLHEFFEDRRIDAIFCIRGGYGTLRLLDRIDYGLIKRNPKVFAGFSDITALHIAISARTGLVTFHGPMPGQDYSSYGSAELLRVAGSPAESRRPVEPPPAGEGEKEEEGPRVPVAIRGGRAEGPLSGGNLTLVSRLMGTPFQPDFRGRIAFFEDVGEPPYRIDGMLSQLRLAGKLDECAGIILGRFTNARSTQPATLSVAEVFREVLGGLPCPVLAGFPCGHVPDQTTLPYGVRARLDADAGRLSLLEAPVR